MNQTKMKLSDSTLWMCIHTKAKVCLIWHLPHTFAAFSGKSLPVTGLLCNHNLELNKTAVLFCPSIKPNIRGGTEGRAAVNVWPPSVVHSNRAGHSGR